MRTEFIVKMLGHYDLFFRYYRPNFQKTRFNPLVRQLRLWKKNRSRNMNILKDNLLGMKNRQIAEKYGITISTVAQILSTTQKKMYDFFLEFYR